MASTAKKSTAGKSLRTAGKSISPKAKEVALKSLASAILDRYRWAKEHGITFDGSRNLGEVLGRAAVITVSQYRARYARGGLAGRIVDAMPNATWRGDMELIEDEDPKVITKFEQTWIDFEKRLKVKSRLYRADKLSRLSTFAVLLIGAPGEDVSQELPKGDGTPENIKYLKPFIGGGAPIGNNLTTSTTTVSAGSASASVFEYETGPDSPRFGEPKSYTLRLPNVATNVTDKPVHWSRIIHIAEDCLEDDTFGQPALERVWDLLDDLDKVRGGGAEAFWLRANQGIQFNLDKDLTMSDEEKQEMREQAEEYQHGIRRMFRTRGMEVNTLGSDVANFSNPQDAIITEIAGSKAIPKRILTGSEMGELASSQDRENWRDQINGRQVEHVGPNIVKQLVDRLIDYNYLPTPAKGKDAYEIRWPHIQTLTNEERAAGALNWANINQTMGEVVFTAEEIRDHWWSMSPLTEEQIAKEMEKAAAKMKAQQDAMAEGQLPGKDENGKPIDDKADDKDKKVIPFKAANNKIIDPSIDEMTESELELTRVLGQAIKDGNIEVIASIVGAETDAFRSAQARDAAYRSASGID